MALRDQPYLPLYIQDFLTDEKLAECTAEATGVYIRLMCLMHKSESYGKILLKQKYKQNSVSASGFARQLVKHLPYTEHVIENSLRELLDEKVLFIDGDYLIQKRMVKDAEVSIKRAVAGKRGGDKNTPQEAKPKANSEAKLKAKAQANAEIENEIENDNEDVIEDDNKGDEVQKVECYPTFDDFWNDYDKKRGDKEKLKKKWLTLPQQDKEAIMEYIPRYKTAQPDKQYRKDPATFLNNRAWEDEIIFTKQEVQKTEQTRKERIDEQYANNSAAFERLVDQALSNGGSESDYQQHTD